MTTDEKNVKDTNTAEEPQSKRAIIKDKIKTFFSKLITAFDEALYPKDCTCDVCGAELVADTRVRLCSHCVDTLPFVGEHICQYAVCHSKTSRIIATAVNIQGRSFQRIVLRLCMTAMSKG